MSAAPSPANHEAGGITRLAAVLHDPATRVLAGLLIVFGALLIATTWQGDDAYITLRIVDNYLHGHGLTWNVGERVQAATHPLWLLLLISVCGITGEHFHTLHALSLIASFAAGAILALRVASTRAAGAFALAALLSSKAFIDFSSSGLENPLTHALLAAAILQAQRTARAPSERKPFRRLCLLGGLLLLNRADLLLLVAPLILVSMRSIRWRDALFDVLLGVSPWLLWLAFATVYFGSPAPNTALAKLNVGIPATDLLRQGAHFLMHNVREDLPTIAVLFAGLIATLVSRTRIAVGLSIGVTLYVAYVVKIGGDFMGGRMLAAPLLACVAIIATDSRIGARALAAFGVLLACVAMLMPRSPLTTLWSTRCHQPYLDRSGIADEPAFYFPYTSLTRGLYGMNERAHWWANEGLQLRQAARDSGTRVLYKHENVGFVGYYAGPNVHIVDCLALADPLLSHLQVDASRAWRPGHFSRELPAGYMQSLESGENRIEDPQLAAFYDDIRRITRAPLLDGERLRAIVRMNLGVDEYLLPQHRQQSSR